MQLPCPRPTSELTVYCTGATVGVYIYYIYSGVFKSDIVTPPQSLFGLIGNIREKVPETLPG